MPTVCHHSGDGASPDVTDVDARPVAALVTASRGMKGKFPNNLKKAMKAASVGPTELARAVDTSKQNIARWADGERRLTPETARLLAPHLSTTWEQLLMEEAQVPLVGWVGAGAEAHFYASADDPDEMVAAPDGWTPETVAVEVRGDSLGALFDHWLVYYDQVKAPVTADLIGRLCVVGLPDGRVLVKMIRRAKASYLYHLLSNTEEPILDVEIEWAARVKNMAPRG